MNELTNHIIFKPNSVSDEVKQRAKDRLEKTIGDAMDRFERETFGLLVIESIDELTGEVELQGEQKQQGPSYAEFHGFACRGSWKKPF